MAVKIKLTRLGKIRNPQYRIVVADARTRRDGRVIETIGKYHPKEEPSLIEVDSERAQYWLSVGAQPTEPVAALLKVTGDWQKFKGLPGAEGTLKTKEAKASKQELFNAALAAAESCNQPGAGGGGVGRRLDRRQGDIRQVLGVAALVADGRRDLGPPRPQHDLPAGVGEHLGEGRAPGPGAEDGDPADHAPACR